MISSLQVQYHFNAYHHVIRFLFVQYGLTIVSIPVVFFPFSYLILIPAHMLKDNGACVKACKEKKRALNNECVECDGPCPKSEYIILLI